MESGSSTYFINIIVQSKKKKKLIIYDNEQPGNTNVQRINACDISLKKIYIYRLVLIAKPIIQHK